MIFTKTWKRLPDFHKTIKVREYVVEKFEADAREPIEKLLCAAIQNKELNRDEYVNYDNINGRIIDIPVLFKTPMDNIEFFYQKKNG